MKGRAVPTVVVPPPHVQAAIDDDGTFFAAHPELDERIRPYVAGELTDERGVEMPPLNGLVYVARIHGPLRLRFRAEVRNDPEIAAMIRDMRQRFAES